MSATRGASEHECGPGVGRNVPGPNVAAPRLQQSLGRGCCFDGTSSRVASARWAIVCGRRLERSDSVIAELSACSVSDGSLAA